ncbi:MAG: LLM class F420-dependent oxidoreductase [Chloroflexi bacterium]|nr:LLM class F420-dependent oxidoreductase [Chloroflexota bacterium]
MQLGVVFPQTEIGADVAVIRDYTQTAEGLGYSYLLAYDHVLGANPERPGGWRGPYTFESQFHEPFTLFSYLAAITQQVEFVTGILILPQRQTALVAKQVAQLDLLSGGRVRLGIGIGWNPVEYEALNQDFSNRGKRSEEQVLVLRELWTKPLVTFEGEYHTIRDAGLNPLPVQRPIPIWFGGGADAVLKRMARLGDGWMPNTMSFEKTAVMVEKLHTYLAEAGRDPRDFGLDIRISLNRHPRGEWAETVQMWQDFGATHLSINTMGSDLTPQEHIAAISEFKAALDG